MLVEIWEKVSMNFHLTLETVMSSYIENPIFMAGNKDIIDR